MDITKELADVITKLNAINHAMFDMDKVSDKQFAELRSLASKLSLLRLDLVAALTPPKKT